MLSFSLSLSISLLFYSCVERAKRVCVPASAPRAKGNHNHTVPFCPHPTHPPTLERNVIAAVQVSLAVLRGPNL